MSGNELVKDTFLQWRRYLTRVVSTLVPPDDIEDIVQESYVRLCQVSANENVREPRALMVKIARNLAFDQLKRADRKLRVCIDDVAEADLVDASAQSDPLRIAVSNEEFGKFCEAVRALPTQCQRVFVLKKVYGYSQREIAENLDISENTVEKHIAKGMLHCARYMKQTMR